MPDERRENTSSGFRFQKMQLDTKEVRSGLKRKGFREAQGPHPIYNYLINGCIETTVKSPVGGQSRRKYKTLGSPLLSRIAKSLHFDNIQQLKEFVECPMLQEEYEALLRDKRAIEPP